MSEQIKPTAAVDFGKITGPVRNFHGINLGPLSFMGTVDASAYYREIEFPLVRLHDCPYFFRQPVVDLPHIFPFDHLDADDPRNYRFKITDGYIQSIVDCHCPIIYRLGVSIEGVEKYRFFTDPPKDVEQWITVASNIIRHYNQGWANGFHHGIRYWEIWNEPDNGPSQWNGPFEGFIAFYIRVAKELKKRFPELSIGGPALNGGMLENASSKLDAFLPSIVEAGAPLDFLSWHVYPRRPDELVNACAEVRQSLDRYGFADTESHLNEWNIGPVENNWDLNGADIERRRANFQEMRSIRNSALVTSCFTALQESPVDMTNFYHGSNITRGIFDEFGEPLKVFHAFRAYKRLLTTTPNRCAVEGSEPDDGLAILPAVSDDGNSVQLLLTNYDTDRECWRIELENLPFEDPLVDCWAIDDVRDLTAGRKNQAVLKGTHLETRVPRQTVCLVRLSKPS